MNNLSLTTLPSNVLNYRQSISIKLIIIIITLLITGLGVSIFILAVVHNAAFFVAFFFFSAVVAAVLAWNIVCFRRKSVLFRFVHSFPRFDLRFAGHGQLVKISGPVSCGNVSLESSYERVSKCVYTSTLLYEYHGFGFTMLDANVPSFLWRLAYLERFSTDFYISDENSGIQALVKAGCGSRVVPLIFESTLVNSRRNRMLSPSLKKWLSERDLSADSRLIRLEEGYIKEGDRATVIGVLHKSDNIATIVQPPELISTGCLWQKLILPVDFDGLIIGLPTID
ncbi:hypothetical protein RND81_03G224400 [Saponaria officinalis]|uniref:Uncharacterized protein n=1 Tax=Saponaria officinalis TaxID=3572 RepID=A0AAW1M282_SAPOF